MQVAAGLAGRMRSVAARRARRDRASHGPYLVDTPHGASTARRRRLAADPDRRCAPSSSAASSTPAPGCTTPSGATRTRPRVRRTTSSIPIGDDEQLRQPGERTPVSRRSSSRARAQNVFIVTHKGSSTWTLTGHTSHRAGDGVHTNPVPIVAAGLVRPRDRRGRHRRGRRRACSGGRVAPGDRCPLSVRDEPSRPRTPGPPGTPVDAAAARRARGDPVRRPRRRRTRASSSSSACSSSSSSSCSATSRSRHRRSRRRRATCARGRLRLRVPAVRDRAGAVPQRGARDRGARRDAARCSTTPPTASRSS